MIGFIGFNLICVAILIVVTAATLPEFSLKEKAKFCLFCVFVLILISSGSFLMCGG